MIVQFLRDRLTSPTRSLADKREALHGLAQVLYIMRGGELSHSWWGETVATLKVVPQQRRLLGVDGVSSQREV